MVEARATNPSETLSKLEPAEVMREGNLAWQMPVSLVVKAQLENAVFTSIPVCYNNCFRRSAMSPRDLKGHFARMPTAICIQPSGPTHVGDYVLLSKEEMRRRGKGALVDHGKVYMLELVRHVDSRPNTNHSLVLNL